MKTPRMAIVSGLMLAVLAGSALADGILGDSNFGSSADSADLRADSVGQDWYESRQDQSDGPLLLTLDRTPIGNNTTAKAKLSASPTRNAYLTQEFNAPQTQAFSVQWDIYVDSILDIKGDPDRAGWMLIGDDTGTDPNRVGPNAEDGERFVYMAFYKDGGGAEGTMDLVAIDRIDSWDSFTTVAADLNLKQWYRIKVSVDVASNSYDVYVDDQYKATSTSRTPKNRVTHISFAQWNDGAGTFYVDNVTGMVDPGPPNKINYEWWLNISGTAVSALTSNPRYPNSPDGGSLVDAFQSPVDWADNYGQCLSGWLRPPHTGNYTFWIAGDDEQQLWLSTDTSPANAVMVANVPGWTSALEWTKYPSQKSAPVALKTGQKYFIMALGKEGSGGDSTAVAWQGPGIDDVPKVIDAQYVDQFAERSEQASGLNPANGERVPADLPFVSWGTHEAAKLYYVYFGTSPELTQENLVAITPLTLYYFDVGLTAGITYYWRVDVVPEEAPVIKGTTVYFMTTSVGCDIVRLKGYVRDIVTGKPITAYDDPAHRATLSLTPHDGSGATSCSTKTDGYYKKWVTEGACYDVTVIAQHFQPDGPVMVQCMDQGDTIRDFVLWPESVSVRPSRPIYRFRSPVEPTSYYFTADILKMTDLLFDDVDPSNPPVETRDPNNWEYNGIAFCGVENGGDKVYRFVCNNNGEKISAYAFESANLDVCGGTGWTQQGTSEAFRAYRPDKKPAGDTDVVAIYRLWSSSLKCYVYVPESEKNAWVGDWTGKFVWWAYPCPGQ